MGRWKEQTSPYEILSDDEDADHEDHADIVRKIIANEMDMDIADVADDLNLTSLGMDSFASCRVLTALREVTKAEVSPVLLMECSTVLEIETALGLQRDDESPSPRSLLTISSSGPLTPLGWSPLAQDGCGYFFDDALTLKQQPPPQLEPPATSVLLQGSPKRATKTLFLFPDGSGSAYSYARLAPLDPSVAVYGLNCPYRTTPEGWVTGIPGVSRLYLEEIRRRQPKGPYYLGGWSAGGIVAYEITQQLMARGESVEQIILIDSPCPVSLEPLPEYLHQFLDDIGLLGTGGIGTSPTWLIPHFRKAIKALDEYQPVPMRPGTAPKVVAIWAGEGVCNGRGAPARPKEYLQSPGPAKWLLDGRTDFGDNGWGQLFPAADMVFATTAGNHFTMMAGDNVGRGRG
jgi:acyl carrier protein